jgi:hypothetical protein
VCCKHDHRRLSGFDGVMKQCATHSKRAYGSAKQLVHTTPTLQLTLMTACSQTPSASLCANQDKEADCKPIH